MALMQESRKAYNFFFSSQLRIFYKCKFSLSCCISSCSLRVSQEKFLL